MFSPQRQGWTRRLARVCIAGGLVALAGAHPLPGQVAETRPNIVLILADDLGYETLESYGGTSYSTPNLNRLAAEGIRFERAYATPLCSPSRVQLMTGKHNFRNYRRFGRLEPGEVTFANLLREAGYATAIAGKWQLGGGERAPHDFGFDEHLLWQLEQGFYWSRFGDPIVDGSATGRDTLNGRYGPDVFAEFLEDFIERNRAGPFLVYFPMVLTHRPFHPPPGHPDFDDFAFDQGDDPAYFGAMVEYMDHIVGRIMAKLDALGLRENTLVLFVGDNGTDVPIASKVGDRVVEGAKGRSTDAGTRVPLIASWTATTPAGAVRPELVDIGDLFPTLLDVAGIAATRGFREDGISLYPTLTTGAPHPRSWIFRDYHPGKETPVSAPARWVQDIRYKLYADGRFFDYVADPLEQSPLRANLTPPERKAREALSSVMNDMQAEIRRTEAEALARGGAGPRAQGVIDE